MEIEKIKNRIVKDSSRQYKMTSEKGGFVEFAIDNESKIMFAHMWTCSGEGRRFLKELEKYAENNNLLLIINNVINPALEHIMKTSDYDDFYIEMRDGDVVQCFIKK